jgi:hypothetical protein
MIVFHIDTLFLSHFIYDGKQSVRLLLKLGAFMLFLSLRLEGTGEIGRHSFVAFLLLLACCSSYLFSLDLQHLLR